MFCRLRGHVIMCLVAMVHVVHNGTVINVFVYLKLQENIAHKVTIIIIKYIMSLCTTLGAEGLTFNGNTYVQFSLLSENGRNRLQTTQTQLLSNYQESISLWFRTETENGILFLIGNITSEYIQIKVYQVIIMTIAMFLFL